MHSSLSKTVTSNQSGVHENLRTTIYRHSHRNFLKPISTQNAQSYSEVIKKINRSKIIFDSGCGNGKSTQRLAKLHPDAFVVGIDKSHHRLSKAYLTTKNKQLNNYCTVCADLIDFLRLAKCDGLKLYKHYLLYPNPWPKKKHLMRRWHGSPVFHDIVKLGGEIEIRSNWKIYLDEFSLALAFLGEHGHVSQLKIQTTDYLSDFEAKYHRSGHQLWKLTAKLDVDITA